MTKPDTQSARDWLSEGVREKRLDEETALAIMKIIENPQYLSQLEVEVEILKQQILNKLK